jgi:predicted kinase
MTKYMHIMRGLPGSGKSTRATEIVEADTDTFRVNMDSGREMLRPGRYDDFKTAKGRSREKAVLHARNALINGLLTAGFSVVVDDTNLNDRHVDELERMARAHRAEVKVHDLRDVPPDECIRRCAERTGPTDWRQVITGMADRHDLWSRHHVVQDDSLPECVIFDVDGTLALHVDRSPYDESLVSTDRPNPNVVALARALQEEVDVVITSGRTDGCREATERWLLEQGVVASEVFMRAVGDQRKDSVVKEEILRRDVLTRFRVRFVVDDRQQVVDAWRRLGLECWQVAPGQF